MKPGYLSPAQHQAVTRDRIERARLWLIPCSVIWWPMGLGTINDLAGKPQDAPHLLIPDDLRGAAWIMTGLAAFLVLMWDQEHTEKATRTAASLLLVMPLVRALSYSVAGIYSIIDLDGGGGLSGSPSAYYTADPWIVISLAILTQAVNWRAIGRRVNRRMKGRS